MWVVTPERPLYLTLFERVYAPAPNAPRSALNVEKAKDKARKLELKGQFDKAIDLYTKIIRELENTPELYHELSLFNKVGDLYLKTGSPQPAVEMYERAANLYAESGLPNNAIALCNKILRNAPGRTQVYLKLAQLMVLRGFVAEAKQNLLEYAERMQRAGRLEEAFEALKEFADLSPANEEIRLLLAEQLKTAARTDEAREQLDKLYAELQATGDTRRSRVTLEKIRAIDPEYDVDDTAPAAPAVPRGAKTGDLVFLDLGPEPSSDVAMPTAPVDADETIQIQRAPFSEMEEGDVELMEIERTSEFDLGVVETPAEPPAVDQLEGLETPSWAEEDTGEVPALDIEPTLLDDSLEEESDAAGVLELDEEEDEDVELPLIAVPEDDEDVDDDLPIIAGTEIGAEEEALTITGRDDGLALDDGGAIEAPDLDLTGLTTSEMPAVVDIDDEGPEVDVPALDIESPAPTGEPITVGAEPAPPPGPPDIATLEARVADDPDDPVTHRALAEALIEAGERERGLEELDLALQMHEGREEWSQAKALVDEMLRLEPNSAQHHQKRVELAFRSGEKARLVEAYLGLADALVRTDDVERARLVYQRVLEHDTDNESARAALETLEPVEGAAEEAEVVAATPQPGRGSGFVDLGELVLDDTKLERDTRMRIEEEEPTGDEEKDFERMLSRFKRGIEVNIEEEDAQAHYDLGIAFKEMGLLDEAISEFQKALRAADSRLRTSEALGLCFFEKGQFSVAATVLRRAIDSETGGDEQKIGLLYWLGRCEEHQNRPSDALQHYQRVFAIDINFGDVSDRVRTLAGTGS